MTFPGFYFLCCPMNLRNFLFDCWLFSFIKHHAGRVHLISPLVWRWLNALRTEKFLEPFLFISSVTSRMKEDLHTRRKLSKHKPSNLVRLQWGVSAGHLATETYVGNQITANALQANLPFQIHSGIIQRLFKPTAVTAPNSMTLTANDLTGALNIEPVPDNLEFTTIKLKIARM